MNEEQWERMMQDAVNDRPPLFVSIKAAEEQSLVTEYLTEQCEAAYRRGYQHAAYFVAEKRGSMTARDWIEWQARITEWRFNRRTRGSFVLPPMPESAA
jgi:hypothetical protein